MTPHARAPSKMPFTLTARDIEIIRTVETHRLLRSRTHLVPLFGGSLHVLRRLQRLSHERYLYRLARRPHEEGIYGIGDRGSDLLSSRFGTPRPKVEWTQQNKTLSQRHIEHTLLISDVLVQIELACHSEPYTRFVSLYEAIERYGSVPVKARASKVGGHPLRWRVRVRDGRWHGEASIEPDGLFGVERAGKTNWFFLEADRGTMPVLPERPQLDRSSLFKKMLQYQASWRRDARGESLTSRAFGIADVRTLFALATGARGNTRLERCLEANRHFYGGKGTGLFLFAKREALLEAPDVLRAPLTSGTGAARRLLPDV